jgi:hypothetical protein
MESVERSRYDLRLLLTFNNTAWCYQCSKIYVGDSRQMLLEISIFEILSCILTGQDTGCVAKFLSGPFHSILSFQNIGTSIERRFIQESF